MRHHVREVLLFHCVIVGSARRAGVNVSFAVSDLDESAFYIAKMQPLRWETILAFHSCELEVSKQKIDPLSHLTLPRKLKMNL